MKVSVTNVAPDFATVPSYKTNYQLHVMSSFQVTLPALYDADGGQVTLQPFDTPSTGATALNLAHDSSNNKLTITST